MKKSIRPESQLASETHTIELSTDELLLIARVTGTILGYAVPDRYYDRRLLGQDFQDGVGLSELRGVQPQLRSIYATKWQ